MEALVALAFLACPIGMGLMMWFMAKGMRRGEAPGRPEPLGDLRAEHERLGREIARLETDDDRARAHVGVSR